MQIAQVHHTRAMRAAGANIYSASNLHPRLHVVIPELVCQIQAKRRKTQRDKECKTMVKKEDMLLSSEEGNTLKFRAGYFFIIKIS
jgi:hypothetical protein